MEGLFALILVIGIVLYNTVCWGYVGFKFYQWFVFPFFDNLPTFNYVHFIGFVLFVSVMTHKGSTHIKEEYRDTSSEWAGLLVSPWVTLFLGFIIKQIYF